MLNQLFNLLNDRVLAKSLFFLPLFILLIFLISDIPITNTDALTYHLYKSKILIKKGIIYELLDPLKISVSLGYGLSSYYPSLYSNTIALISMLTKLSLFQCAYLLSIILYIQLYFYFKNSFIKLSIIGIIFLIPPIFNLLLTSGTNYLLLVILFFTFYKLQKNYLNNKNLKKYSHFFFSFSALILGLLILRTHVLGILCLSIIFLNPLFTPILFRFIHKKHLYFQGIGFKSKLIFNLIVYFLILIFYFLFNKITTGSITFPFFQNFFPIHNYNQQAWDLISSQVFSGVFNETLSNKKTLLITILTVLISFNLKDKFVSIFNKNLFIALCGIFFSSLIFIFGMRHRILFIIPMFLIFLDLISIKNLNLSKQTLLGIYKAFLYLLVILILGFVFKNIYENINYKNNTSLKIKNCYYNSINNLAKNNKVILSETELFNINIETIKNLTPIETLLIEKDHLNNEQNFYNYLVTNNIRFITTSPLFAKHSPVRFRSSETFIKFLDSLLKKNKVKLLKQCSFYEHDSDFNLKQSAFPHGWNIYEILGVN